MLEKAFGGEDNPNAAIALYRQAGDGAYAEGSLSKDIPLEFGVDLNIAEARRYYRLACDKGAKGGCTLLKSLDGR